VQVQRRIPGGSEVDRAGFGILLLHGFTGGPAALSPLERACARSGWFPEIPLLPGHGTTPEDLDRTTFADWVERSEEAFASLAERRRSVAVIGLSMGGLLALRLAARHRAIAGVVLINPLAEPVAPEFVTLLTEAVARGGDIPSIGSDIARPDHPPTGGYDATPPRALLSLVHGITDVTPELGAITAPVLLFSSRTDHVVPTSTAAFLASRLTCPLERVILERSFHVATLDYDGEEIVRRTVEFLGSVAP
jgi:carboxylesterase